MKKRLLVAMFALSVTALPINAQFVDLLSFGSSTFSVDPGSTAVYTQSASGITMITNPGLGDTWYNDSMTKFVSDWSSFPEFGLRMSSPGPNPGFPFTIFLYDTAFSLVNEYQATTFDLGATPTVVPLSLSLPGSGNLADVQYVQFSWGGGGSNINVTTTEIVGVPEPSTYALLSLGALALGGYAARRRLRK